MHVIDGFHRIRACQIRGDRQISAVIFDGDEDEAFVLSVHLNTLHGLPLSLAERKAAARRIVGAHPEWSDRSIAAVAGLSDKTVATLRKQSTAELPHPAGRRVASNGVQHPVDSAAGRLRAAELFKAKPDLSGRAASIEAGISLTTAKDVRNRLRKGKDPLPARQRNAYNQVVGIDPASDVRGSQIHHRSLDAPQTVELLQRLRADPSLRFTESGRMLLREFGLLMIDPDAHDAIARNVPSHCAPLVAELAHQCASGWQRFAAIVEDQMDEAAS